MTPNDVKIVADNIDDFIEVPDGLERLRKAVLTLAVAGKLVTQDKKEGTAEELYVNIQSERAEKSDGGKKNSKEFAPVASAEIPFDIPKSWKWVPLGSLFLDYGSGSTPSRSSDKYYSENGLNWYKSGELNDSILPAEAQEKVTELALKECRLRIFKPGDFLIAMYGATAGRIAVSRSIGTTNQAVWSGTPVSTINDRYLYYYVLQSRQILIDKSSGAAQPNISGEKIIAHSFALPPLLEQKRIVEKVEEVMKQLDELEAKKRERDEVRVRLARSAMQSLGRGESKVAFEHLSELIKTHADLKELEGALLTLAVSGKLVPQDKKEGTGAELYTQIHSEIEASGKKKNNQKTHHTIPIELPFEIPESWCKVELGEITYQITDGTHFTPTYIEKGVPFLSIKDVSGGRLDFSNTKYISEKEHAVLVKRCSPQFDDILFCRIGTLGRAVLVDDIRPFSIFVSLGLIKYPTSQILPKYLLTVLISPCLYAQFDQIKAGGSHTNKLNLKEMPRLIIPLPPIGEQKRIVKKVEEVMSLVNKLKPLVAVEK